MSLFVALARIDIFIPHSQSLKEKRSVLNSIKERVRQLNAAVAEVEGQDLWQRAVLGVSLVGAEPGRLQDALQQVRQAVEREPRALVSGFDWDVTPSPWD